MRSTARHVCLQECPRPCTAVSQVLGGSRLSHQRDLPVLPPFVRPSSLVFRCEYSLVLTTTFFFSDRDLARHDADFRGYGPGASYGLLANVYMVLTGALGGSLQNSVVDSLASLVSACLMSPLKF